MTVSYLATVAGRFANSSGAWLVTSSVALGIFHLVGADVGAWRYAAGATALVGIAMSWVLFCDRLPLDTEV